MSFFTDSQTLDNQMLPRGTPPYTALFGGSFDPFHLGHLEILKYLFQIQIPPISRVVLMPTFCNPLKNQSLFPPLLRLEMCEQIAQDMRLQGYCVEVSDFEVRQNRAVYSIESVEFLLSRGISPLAFVMGEDSLKTLMQWKNAKQLCEMVEFIIIERTEVDKSFNLPPTKIAKPKCSSPSLSPMASSHQNLSFQIKILSAITLPHNTTTWASSHIKALLQADSKAKALELIPPSLHRFCK